MSLAEARRVALERNADFRIARIQVDAALAQLRAAREFPNPTLGLSTAKISTDGTPESTPMGNSLLNRAYDSIVSLSQLIQISKRGLIRDSANAGVHVAEFQKEDAQRLLLQAVTQAYVAALSSQEQARVLTESAAALRRQAEIAAHRYHAGDLSKSDQGRIEIAADQDELGAQSEVAAAKSAVVALESLLGNPDPDGSTELSDSLSQLSQAAAPGLEDMALSDRPDIAAAEAGVEQAETNLKLQRRERVPDVTVSLQFERNPPAQPDTIGVGLSLPLPLWNQYTGEILGAQAARNQAEAHLDSVRVQAAADVSAARVAYREARDRARRYEQSLVPKSAEVTKSVVYAYEKGGAALIDLLDAQRNDNSIRQAAVQADADA
ncbi:MAG: TolC family protein, partial [Opitutaceae bacterium]